MVFWISFRTDSARCNEKRRALWSSKNQIDRVLSRIFIHSHCKVRSHNPKGSCACHEKKKNPWFRSRILWSFIREQISCGLFYSGRGLHKRQKEPFIRLQLTSDANCWYKWFTASSAARPVQWWRSLFWCERAQSVEWIKRDVPAMDEVEKMDEISGSLVKQIIFPPMQRASLGHEGLVYNWKQSMCEHVQACAAIVQSFSKSRKTYECTYPNPLTSKLSRGLDKPSPKLLGQDKPRLELAVGWISHSY